MSKHPTEVLDYEGLSKLLSVSISTLRLWVVAGEIPPGRRLGRQRLWSRAEIAAWVAAGRPPARAWRQMQEVA